MTEPKESEALYDEVGVVPPVVRDTFKIERNESYRTLNLQNYDVPKKATGGKGSTPTVACTMTSEDKASKSSTCVIIIVITILVVLLILGATGCSIVISNKISKSATSTLSVQQQTTANKISELEHILNFSISPLLEQQSLHLLKARQDLDDRINELELTVSANLSLVQADINLELEQSRNGTQLKFNVIESSIFGLETTTEQLVNVLQGIVGLSANFSASSCAALPPSSPSGYYWVRASNGSAVRVYCDMTRSCGGVTGGWIRVAELDMTNVNHQCPSGLRQRTHSNIRTCVSSSSSVGCSSDIALSTANIQYTQVCGKIIGYQIGNTNAFLTQVDDIDSHYVDGVSLTHDTPRQHIWTFAAARDENDTLISSNCPCIFGGVAHHSNSPPSFVGDDYFCDTGSAIGGSSPGDTFFGEDPLWDGAGCGPRSTCCSFNTPPWFYKQLPQPTTDDIEMRVCRDEESRNEDVGIAAIQIYIQ